MQFAVQPIKPKEFVIYCRVSLARRDRSRLNIDAQRDAAARFLEAAGGVALDTFIEVERGTRGDRPQFANAVALCRTTGATLLIARLDRLAGDADFLRALQASGVQFVAADLPAAGQLTLDTMLVAAEVAARGASARISKAMAAAKARGVKIGGWRGGPEPDSTAGNAAKSRKADAFAQKIAPVAAQLRAEGRTLGQVAQILTERGIPTARDGSTWTAMGVLRVLNRSML